MYKVLFFTIITILYSQECNNLQNLYTNGDLQEAYDSIILDYNVNNLNEECQFLAFNITFELENFDQSKQYLDLLLKNNPDNSDYVKSSILLTKVLQDYKSAKYTLEKINTDEAITEYEQKILDSDLSKISLFYSGLAKAYKKKDLENSQSDSMKFELLDLAVDNFNVAHKLNAYKEHDEEVLNITKLLTKRAKNEIENDNYNTALSFLNKGIEYYPDYNLAYFYRGNLYMKIQDFELAAKSYEAGLGSNFKDGNPKILYLLGLSNQKIGKLDLAKQFFNYSINNDPHYLKAHFALANVLYSQQQFIDAKESLLELIQKDSTYVKAYELIVNVFLDLKEYSKAKEYANKGISINNKSYILYALLAFLDNESQLYDDAVNHSNKSLSIKRNYGPALIALATANVYLCNRVAADDAFKRARKYDRRQVSQLQEWSKEHYKSICK